MDRFGYSLLPLAAEAGLDTITVSRHLPLFRRCVERDERALAIAPCSGPHRRLDGGLLMLLTQRRLMVVQQTRHLHHVRLHVHAELERLTAPCCLPAAEAGSVRVEFQLRGREHRFTLSGGTEEHTVRLTRTFRAALGLDGDRPDATDLSGTRNRTNRQARGTLHAQSAESFWTAQPRWRQEQSQVRVTRHFRLPGR